jgi:hypothetical protein
MNRRLWSLELSAVMTFGLLGILTLTSGISWKERGRLISENQRLHWELTQARIAEPCRLAAAKDCADPR